MSAKSSNPYYQPGPERAQKVRALFSRIARRYDFINDVQSLGLHRTWKRKLVNLAQPKESERALDVCTGTGDIAFRMAQSGASVVGIDFTPGMLDLAQSRDANRTVQFVQADAEHLPFASNSFEIASVGYGLRNLPSWRRGLEEMVRVLKPEGRLLILDFSRPENGFWRKLYFGYLQIGLPLFGQAFCGDRKAYAYILESLKHYASPGEIALELQTLGCSTIETGKLIGGAMSLIRARKTSG